MKLLLLALLVPFISHVRAGLDLDLDLKKDDLDFIPKIDSALVSLINGNKSNLFTAKLYSRFQGLTKLQLKSFLGLLPDPKIQAAKAAKLQQSATANRAKRAALPAQFNASTKWPSCKSVFETIQDQSNCGSCWAVSTASVISDRRCILYNSPQLPTSSWDLVSCCDTCRADSNGCNGGWPTEAFDFYINTGVVTGGKYGSTVDCKPYTVAPNAANQPTSTPCSMTCQTKYTMNEYEDDRRYGSSYDIFVNENQAVMEEIYSNGPVVATMAIYEDFYAYSSGVYRHTTGQLVGYHAVRIIGWGQTSAGVKYWTVANSWGTSWGIAGVFNIIRDTNDCEFEEGIVSGSVLPN